jgi:hypothetical protein
MINMCKIILAIIEIMLLIPFVVIGVMVQLITDGYNVGRKLYKIFSTWMNKGI